MGNGCRSVSSSIICPQRLFPGVQIQLKVSLAQSEIQLALTIFYYVYLQYSTISEYGQWVLKCQ